MRRNVTLLLLGVAGLLLLMTGMGLQQGCSKKQIDALKSAQARVEMEAAGYRDALVVKEKELAKRMELPKTAIEAGVKPVVLTRVVTKTVQVEVPITTIIPCDSPAVRLDMPVGAPPTRPVQVMNMSAETYFSLAVLPDGKPQYKSSVFVSLAGDDWNQRIELEPEYNHSEVQLSNDVTAALRAWAERPARIAIAPRPLRHARLGWTVGLDPVRSTTDSTFAVAAVWGVQF